MPTSNAERELNKLGVVVTKMDLDKTDPRLGKRNTSLTYNNTGKSGTLTEREGNRVILSSNYNTIEKAEDKQNDEE